MAAKTARTYLNEGLATLAEMKISHKQLHRFTLCMLMRRAPDFREFSEMLEHPLREEVGDVESRVSLFLFPMRNPKGLRAGDSLRIM